MLSFQQALGTRAGQDKEVSRRAQLLAAPSAQLCYPNWTVSSAWAGAFSWPGEKCHVLKCSISLG